MVLAQSPYPLWLDGSVHEESIQIDNGNTVLDFRLFSKNNIRGRLVSKILATIDYGLCPSVGSLYRSFSLVSELQLATCCKLEGAGVG